MHSEIAINRNRQKLNWVLKALFAYPFKFKSHHNIMLFGIDNYKNYMEGRVIYMDDYVINGVIKPLAKCCDMLIYKNAIRLLNNPERQKKSECII